MDIKKKVVIGIAAVAIGTTGTAFAAGGGGPLFGGDGKDELAADLASKLDGVNPGEVERALEQVSDERRSEMTAAQAAAIAAELDGVDADAVADALDKAHEQMREAGGHPDPGSLAATLAEELDIDEDAATTALESAREAEFAERKAEMLDRLDQAVEDGDIDADRAEEIRERLSSDDGAEMRGGPHGPGFGGPGPGGPAFGDSPDSE